jgi:two-component sensor histidine kinase
MIDYSNGGIEIQFSEEGRYIIILRMSDNSTGRSNEFKVNVKEKMINFKTNTTLGTLLIIMVVIALNMNLKLKRDK